MGSVGSQSPLPLYKDCSQNICSINCPQWCYITFPPPHSRTFIILNDGSATDISPLLITAMIGILASALILVGYYTFFCKSFRRRNQVDTTLEPSESHNQARNEACQADTTGLDESIIRSIPTCKYKKGEGLIEGTECSVCLMEFQENEGLRLLPKCNHAFHLPCIDPWLKSHSSCPLCRANVVVSTFDLLPQAPSTTPTPNQEATWTINVSAIHQHQYRINEPVIVIQALEEGSVNLHVGDGIAKNPSDQDLVMNMEDCIGMPTRGLGSSN